MFGGAQWHAAHAPCVGYASTQVAGSVAAAILPLRRVCLGLLFDAYWSGSPVCRTAVVLFEAGYGDSTNAFSKVFSGRDDWRSFIKYGDGNCWIEP